MSYKREMLPSSFSEGQNLTEDLLSIGIILSSKNNINEEVNIENTLISACIEGLKGDLRILGLIFSWLEIHLFCVNADRIIYIINALKDLKLKSLWASFCCFHMNDRRFLSLLKDLPKKSIPLLDEKTIYLVSKNGEDSRFNANYVLVPNKTLRRRLSDILEPKELAKINFFYKYRVLIGPSYRADMWAMLELNPKLTAAELAKKCFGSYATAHRVIKDRNIVQT